MRSYAALTSGQFYARSISPNRELSEKGYASFTFRAVYLPIWRCEGFGKVDKRV